MSKTIEAFKQTIYQLERKEKQVLEDIECGKNALLNLEAELADLRDDKESEKINLKLRLIEISP